MVRRTVTAQQRQADALCAPQLLKCFTEKSTLTGAWKAVHRKAYIRCTDPTLTYMDRFQEHAEGLPDWDSHELATGHDCMITQPQELAELLLLYGR
ncbi:hypothetical protein [Kordiimonas sp.]|uniref:hypothetical protein n=1 Tax=Kordiimonas sp. TaxID=1970157 RepID=UPI003A91A6C6